MTHWTDQVVGFDTETTGTEPRADRIVTAALVLLDAGGEVREKRSWLINPGIPISPAATNVHGITDEIAGRDGMNPAVALMEIVRSIDSLASAGIPVVAFNAPFDFTFLESETARHNVQYERPSLILDPLVIDKAVWKFRKGKRTLTATSELYGVELVDAHDAGADAYAAARLAQVILRSKAPQLDADTLMRLQPMWHEEQSAGLEAYLRRSQPEATVLRGWPVYRS